MRALQLDYGYYHYMMRGNCRQVMMYTDAEFIVALNCLALIAYSFGVVTYAICFMDNHIHVIFRCLRSEVVRFVQAFRISLTKVVRRKQGMAGSLGSRGYKLVELVTDEEKKDALCYCFRNPVHHGVMVNIWGYRWSTIRLYFGNSKPLDSCEIAHDESFIKAHIPRHRVLPSGWLMTTDGLILPQSYVDTSFVEKLFGSEDNFREALKHKTKIEERNDPNDEMKSVVSHTNEEVEKTILRYCKDVLGVDKSILRLSASEKYAVADYLHNNGLVDSAFQMSSILGIPISTLYYNLRKKKK